jgi:hypothetical protein
MKRKPLSLILLGLLVPLVFSFSPSGGIFSAFPVGTAQVQAQEASPTPQPTPTPQATPTEAAETSPPTLPLSESAYIDPQGRFQVGILEGYNIGFAGNWPLIESPDGSLAYTVVVKARESDRVIPSASLAQIAIETFERGEGFQPGTYQTISLNEISLPWTGSLKTGATTQPIQGKIRVRQEGARLLILLVSATESAVQDIDPAVITIADSLKL